MKNVSFKKCTFFCLVLKLFLYVESSKYKTFSSQNPFIVFGIARNYIHDPMNELDIYGSGILDKVTLGPTWFAFDPLAKRLSSFDTETRFVVETGGTESISSRNQKKLNSVGFQEWVDSQQNVFVYKKAFSCESMNQLPSEIPDDGKTMYIDPAELQDRYDRIKEKRNDKRENTTKDEECYKFTALVYDEEAQSHSNQWMVFGSKGELRETGYNVSFYNSPAVVLFLQEFDTVHWTKPESSRYDVSKGHEFNRIDL
jgi:hypothetical protein